HPALVRNAREAPRPRQYAEQRNFGQRNAGGAVVDQVNLIASESELIATAGARTMHRRDELQSRAAACVLDAVARLISKFAEIDLPRVAGQSEHEDIGAGAEDSILEARDHDRSHLRMLETDALDGVVKLDVYPKIVGIELEFVAFADTAIFRDIHRQRRNRPGKA